MDPRFPTSNCSVEGPLCPVLIFARLFWITVYTVDDIYVSYSHFYDYLYEKLWEEMKGIGVSLPLIALIQRLYQECQAAVKIGKRLSRAIQTTKGLRQGCSMSPTLFKIYPPDIERVEQLMSRNGNFSWKRVGVLTVICRQSGDNGAVSWRCEIYGKEISWSFEAGGLEVNMSKTEYQVIGGDGRNIKIPQGIINSVKEFKYLG